MELQVCKRDFSIDDQVKLNRISSRGGVDVTDIVVDVIHIHISVVVEVTN